MSRINFYAPGGFSLPLSSVPREQKALLMRVYGYILVEGERWLVVMNILSTRNILKRRSEGSEGIHLKDVQALLEQSSSPGLMDRLRAGEWVYVPLEKP